MFSLSTQRIVDPSKNALNPAPNRDGLAVEDITIADALREKGYATGHFGKWHSTPKMAKGGGALPSQQGFDVTYDSFGDGELLREQKVISPVRDQIQRECLIYPNRHVTLWK